MLGEPIWVRTLSSHCKGPFRCSSIQQGVLVTVCLLQDIGKGVGWGMLRMSRSTHTHVRMPFPALVTGFFPEPEIRTALLDPVLEEVPLTC